MSAGTKVSAPTIEPAPMRARSMIDRAHAHQHVAADVGAMDDRAVPDVGARLEDDGDTGKGMNDAGLLHVASILDERRHPNRRVSRRSDPRTRLGRSPRSRSPSRSGARMPISCTTGRMPSNSKNVATARAQTRSMMVAIPCPTPTHIVASAYWPPPAASSRAAVRTRRAPDMPNGCPRAMAPPLGFTRAIVVAHAQLPEARQRLSRKSLVQLDHVRSATRESRARQRLARRRHRSHAHGPGLDARYGGRHDTRQRREPELARRLLGRQKNGAPRRR